MNSAQSSYCMSLASSDPASRRNGIRESRPCSKRHELASCLNRDTRRRKSKRAEFEAFPVIRCTFEPTTEEKILLPSSWHLHTRPVRPKPVQKRSRRPETPQLLQRSFLAFRFLSVAKPRPQGRVWKDCEGGERLSLPCPFPCPMGDWRQWNHDRAVTLGLSEGSCLQCRFEIGAPSG